MIRPKFRLRTVLIAVAALAVALGGWRMWRRRAECLALAAAYEAEVLSWQARVRIHEVAIEKAERHVATARAIRDEVRLAGPAWYPDMADQIDQADTVIRVGEAELATREGSLRQAESRVRHLRLMADRCREAARAPWLAMPAPPGRRED
jgi:hypothetical protein